MPLIMTPDLLLHPVSSTFHGRDVFAPFAAFLALGGSLAEVGPPIQSFKTLTWPEPTRTDQGMRGCVLYVDHSGNAITNLPNPPLPSPQPIRPL